MSEKQPRTPLENARIAIGLPRYKAAARIGVTDKTLGTWESGDRSPSLEQAKELATLYGVDLNFLGAWTSARGVIRPAPSHRDEFAALA